MDHKTEALTICSTVLIASDILDHFIHTFYIYACFHLFDLIFLVRQTSGLLTRCSLMISSSSPLVLGSMPSAGGGLLPAKAHPIFLNVNIDCSFQYYIHMSLHYSSHCFRNFCIAKLNEILRLWNIFYKAQRTK